MNKSFKTMTLSTLVVTIIGSCLLASQMASAAEPLAKQSLRSALPLIKLSEYDLKTTVDLKKIKIDKVTIEKAFGPGSGSGGNSCALMILANTKALFETIHDNKVFGDPKIAQKIERTIKGTQIYYGKNLQLDGKTVNAINYADTNSLVIDQDFCASINTVSISSMGLLLHEYMGLSSIDDQKLTLSSAFVTQLKKTGYNPRQLSGEEYLKNIDGVDIVSLEDIVFPAGFGGNTSFQVDHADGSGGRADVRDYKDYDRVLPRGTKMKVIGIDDLGYYWNARGCTVGMTLSVDHPQVKAFDIWREVPADTEEECQFVQYTDVKVKHFTAALGKYFTIKTRAPVKM